MTPKEVADLFLVSPITVRGWAQKGLLPAATTPGGHRRYRADDVLRFARHRMPNMPKKPRRILIVGDEWDLQNRKQWLQALGSEVVVEAATAGFDAVAKMLTFQPDAILLDTQVSRLEGADISRLIKHIPKHVDVRVMAIRDGLLEETQEQLLAAGVHLLASPPTREVLYQALGITSFKAIGNWDR